MMEKHTLAIITARGGSKRIPRKNIKMFLGKPIIAYPIQAALESEVFDEVMVSTEDKEIAAIGKKFGAKVPFYRSQKNADDHATTADVIDEVIKTYQKRGSTFKYACCIYPPAPFITPQKLRAGLELLISSGADSVVPIVCFSYPPQRGVRIKNNKIRMLHPKYINTHSQNLEPVYHDCAQYYFLNTTSFKKQRQYYMKNTLPVVTPETEVQDIDHLEDWLIAEIKYKYLKDQGRL